MLSVSLNKTFPSFLPSFLYCSYYSTPSFPLLCSVLYLGFSSYLYCVHPLITSSSSYIIIFLQHFYHFCQAAIAIKISNLLIGFCSTDLFYFLFFLVVYLPHDIIHKFVRKIMALSYLPVVLHGSIFATTCS